MTATHLTSSYQPATFAEVDMLYSKTSARCAHCQSTIVLTTSDEWVHPAALGGLRTAWCRNGH